jgi:single-strand DNA-binding protein
MNKVFLMGRLTRDPETRYGQGANGIAVTTFSLAVDRRFKREGDPEADFFNCTVFGKQAETAEKYLRKGIKIVVEGRIENDNYTNKEGQKVYSVRILVDGFEFAESKAASDGSASSYSGGSSYGRGNSQQEMPPAEGAGPSGFMPIPGVEDDNLPFSS